MKSIQLSQNFKFISMALAITCMTSCVENQKQKEVVEKKDTPAVQQVVSEPEQEDRSQHFVGIWVDRKTLEYPLRGHIVIEKSGTRFLIHCNNFRTWDGVNGLNGKTLIANYDKQNDKLIVSFGNFSKEIFYNDSDGSLIDGTNTLVPMAYDAH